MNLYALIGSANQVVGKVQIESDAQFEALSRVFPLIVDVTDYVPTPDIGWSFDGQKIVGISQSMKITRLAMRQRFTIEEMLGIMNASSSDLVVKYLMDNLSVATFIDLSSPETQIGLQSLVEKNLLSQERAERILATPPSIYEQYP